MRRDGTRLLLDGPVTMDTVPALLEEARTHCAQGIGIVDFAAVHEADSAAIALVLELQRIARGAGREIAFENLPQSILNLARMYAVSEQIAPQG